MTKSAFMQELENMLDIAKTAVLATVSADGSPAMRWMTPSVIRGRAGALYAVTSRTFAKSEHLAKNAQVQWLLQSKSLDKIITVNGKVNIIENSAMKAEVLEAIGPRLPVFWRVNPDPANLVVLETVVTEGTVFIPMRGEKDTVKFN
ncbi:pyridoxamine 5'-phosphate oxidase [Marispirochaeta aestuarii]|jgi:pyridoxamine 5'-phosphate oxidase|uniref:Pyridoxamine 5'-phosphate oxidase n=1 Tax=Marispirochaeta aestuarii TaxID=1963862 RepID=A0A1Y1RXY5_9SPIO|nr:pyridoxamine 5'-phosphate oxidase family protein [Marispirochaeta aestuarii]ORC35329.1 pyridoxamine 5'-phosphate oxidase [Marispirochaeta aestuarii]